MVLLHSLILPIGEFEALDFDLPATDGEDYSLKDFKDKKGLVVVFTCNHCPYAQAAWPLLIELAEVYQPKDIGFVAINPNDDSLYPDDSFEKMKEKTDELGINFPYLRDKNQTIAKSYKAQCTPDIYVFDRKNKLYYHGRINDSWQNPDEVTSNDLEDALKALINGESPPENQHPSMGCSIKWGK